MHRRVVFVAASLALQAALSVVILAGPGAVAAQAAVPLASAHGSVRWRSNSHSYAARPPVRYAPSSVRWRSNSHSYAARPSVLYAPSTRTPSGAAEAARAVATALAQIGKPYRWAGVGPSSFDCSGLTRFSWGAAGVGMSHSAAIQYASFLKVPAAQLQPGDLVFFGHPISHVGMYIGGGRMVHAPTTGQRVQISSISGFVGAVRPAV
jgi:cell wall-associated NlpC family hydrolase